MPVQKCKMSGLLKALLPTAMLCLAASGSATNVSGQWRHSKSDPPDASRQSTHTVDFTFWQRGDRVFGVWQDNGHRLSSGCIRGKVKGKYVAAQLCLEDGTYGSERGPVCPAYGSTLDRFQLAGDHLAWHRYNEQSRKWERYVTLQRRPEEAKAVWSSSCGTESP